MSSCQPAHQRHSCVRFAGGSMLVSVRELNPGIILRLRALFEGKPLRKYKCHADLSILGTIPNVESAAILAHPRLTPRTVVRSKTLSMLRVKAI